MTYDSNSIDFTNYTRLERFDYLKQNRAPSYIEDYLKSKFTNLKIEIYGDYEGNIMNLMNRELLEGFCWQTTETAILFLDDNASIERGTLKFSKFKRYYHSWIVFKYNDTEYVFDPCLNFLTTKVLYDNVFDIELRAKVSSSEVKEYFINYITNPPKPKLSLSVEESERIKNILSNIFKENPNDETKDEIIIHDKEDVHAPMYRNGVGYKAKIENGKVKKLTAHYYMNA